MFYTLFELSILNKRIEWIQSRRKIFTIISRRMMAYILCNLTIIITSPSWIISLSINSIPNIISIYFNFHTSFSISVQICQFKVHFCLDSQHTVFQIGGKKIILVVDFFLVEEKFLLYFHQPNNGAPFRNSLFWLLRERYTSFSDLPK